MDLKSRLVKGQIPEKHELCMVKAFFKSENFEHRVLASLISLMSHDSELRGEAISILRNSAINFHELTEYSMFNFSEAIILLPPKIMLEDIFVNATIKGLKEGNRFCRINLAGVLSFQARSGNPQAKAVVLSMKNDNDLDVRKNISLSLDT